MLEPAAFGRLCVETVGVSLLAVYVLPAAFGRLCVETRPYQHPERGNFQPPSGGCVLKLDIQPVRAANNAQPPSGGCVLKRGQALKASPEYPPAAFGRLCVETWPR